MSDEFDAMDNRDIVRAFHPILERHFDNFENSSLAGLKDFCRQYFPGSEKKKMIRVRPNIFSKISKQILGILKKKSRENVAFKRNET